MQASATEDPRSEKKKRHADSAQGLFPIGEAGGIFFFYLFSATGASEARVKCVSFLACSSAGQVYTFLFPFLSCAMIPRQDAAVFLFIYKAEMSLVPNTTL